MSTVYLKQNDVGRALSDTLELDGAAADLTDATVVLVWKRPGVAAVRRAASVVSAAAGTVQYVTVAADTEDATNPNNPIQLEWEVTWTSGVIITFPDNDYHSLHIKPDLG